MKEETLDQFNEAIRALEIVSDDLTTMADGLSVAGFEKLVGTLCAMSKVVCRSAEKVRQAVAETIHGEIKEKDATIAELLAVASEHPARCNYDSDLAHYEAILVWWCAKMAPVIARARGDS